MPLKSFKFPNFQIAKTKQHPHDTNSLLIYHHQIHPNPMMQRNKKEWKNKTIQEPQIWEKRKDVQWVSFFLFFLAPFVQPKRRHSSNAKGHHNYHVVKIGRSWEKKNRLWLTWRKIKNQIMNTFKLGHNKCHKDYKINVKKKPIAIKQTKTNRPHSSLPTFFAFLAFFLVLQKEFLVVKYLIWVLPRCHPHLILSLCMHSKRSEENEHRRVRE